MADIIETMKTIPDYIGSNGRTDTEIADAENALGTVFAPDYKRYLKEVGLACFGGHEFTGLTTTERLLRNKNGQQTSKFLNHGML